MASLLPDDFKCPISLEIMTDPVIISSGHTFDRSSIQRWLDSGNRTCPITKQPLPLHSSLIPNLALRSLISNFTLTSPPKSHPDPQTLILALTSPSSPSQSKIDSLNTLARLCKRSPVFRQRLINSGAVAAVLNSVASDHTSLRESGLTLLLNLSLDDDNKVGLVAEGAIGVVVAALRGGNSSCRACAATVLTSLAMLEVNKGTIGAYPSAIGSLVALLKEGKEREKREAATALYVLCSFADNKKRAIERGVVGVLIEMLVVAGCGGVERAVGVLSLLAKCGEGREEMGRVGGGGGCVVEVLVRVLSSGGSGKSVVYALSALNSMCCYSEKFGLEVMRNGGLEICLGLVEDENEKISRNASALVQSLRSCRLKKG